MLNAMWSLQFHPIPPRELRTSLVGRFSRETNVNILAPPPWTCLKETTDSSMASLSGQPDNSFSTDPWTDVVMVNNGWEWVQLNGAVNHSQFCHLGSWGALQNPKQVVSFTGLQSIKSWFYRVGLPSSWFNFDTLPFKAIDWHNPVLFMLVVSSTVQPEFGAQKYMATQCNAMQTVSSKLPSTFCRVDPGGKMSPHPPGLSKQVSPQTMDCAKQKKTLHSVLSYPFVINMFHSHRPQLQKDTSRTLPESIVSCRADFRHLARPGIFRKGSVSFPWMGQIIQ